MFFALFHSPSTTHAPRTKLDQKLSAATDPPEISTPSDDLKLMLLEYVGIVFKATSCFDLSHVMFRSFLASCFTWLKSIGETANPDDLRWLFWVKNISITHHFTQILWYDDSPIDDSPRWGKRPPSNLGEIPMLGKQAIRSGAPRSIAKLSYKPHENSCYWRIIKL